MNYYRRFPGDYLRDTRQLTLLEHGVYTLLLDQLYATEQRIPTELDAVRICQAETAEEQSAVVEILAKFFKKTASGFTNNRYEEEHKKRDNWRKRQKNHRDRARDSHANVTPMSRRNPISHLPSTNTEETSKPKHAAKAAKTTFPRDFAVSAQMRSFAIDRGVANPDALLEAFADYHQARGNCFTNWEAAWRTWCRNDEKFRERRANGGESFDERRQRKSEAVLSEVGARARTVVSEVGRRLPEPRDN